MLSPMRLCMLTCVLVYRFYYFCWFVDMSTWNICVQLCWGEPLVLIEWLCDLLIYWFIDLLIYWFIDLLDVSANVQLIQWTCWSVDLFVMFNYARSGEALCVLMFNYARSGEALCTSYSNIIVCSYSNIIVCWYTSY